jgi:hypothetical protein
MPEPKIVEIPGVGIVEFPADMSDEAISAAIRKQTAPQQQQGKPLSIMREILQGDIEGTHAGLNPIPVLKRVGAILAPGAFGQPGARETLTKTGQEAMSAGKTISGLGSFGMPSGAEELKKGNLGNALSQVMSKSVSQIPFTGPQIAGFGQTIGTGDPRQITRLVSQIATQAALGKLAPFGFEQAKRIVSGMNIPKLLTSQARAQALASGMEQIAPSAAKVNALSTAGRQVKIGINANIAEHKAAADIAYKGVREAAEHPGNVVDVQVGVKQVPPSMVLGPDGMPVMGPTEQPVLKQMALPVDVSPIQMQAKQLLTELDEQLLGQKSVSPIYPTLQRIANGPSKVPFSQAIEDVSVLGKAGFSKDPLIRSRADGIARSIYSPYRAALDSTARSDVTGQVAELLQQGREATKAMYDTRAIASRVIKTTAESGKRVSKESVNVIRGLTVADDAAADMLESLAKDSPNTVPHVAKGYLADVLGEATQLGGFNGAKAFEKWATTGQRTKAVLFGKNKGLQQRLDGFFEAAKLAGDTETSGNLFSLEQATGPSGWRAIVRNTKGARDYWLSSKNIEKLLTTKNGVDLLTRAMTTPASGAGARALSNLIYINSVLPASMKKPVPTETY